MKTTDLNSKIKAALLVGDRAILDIAFGIPYPLDATPDLCLFKYARLIYGQQSPQNRRVLLIAVDIADEMDLYNTVLTNIWPRLNCVKNIVNYYRRSVNNTIVRYCGSRLVNVDDDDKCKTIERCHKTHEIVRSTRSLDETVGCYEDIHINRYDITPSSASSEDILERHECDKIFEDCISSIKNAYHRAVLRLNYETGGLSSAQLSAELAREGVALTPGNIDTIKSRAVKILKAAYYKTF